MRVDLTQYNKVFENKIRLQIMSVLMANDYYDFSSLKELLEVTDGNLASNIKTLEKEGYISVEKSFVDRKPNTRYSRTKEGAKAFENHIAALESIIRSQK